MLDYLRSMIGGQVATRRNEHGASAVEYGLLIAGIAALVVLAVFALGGSVSVLYGDTCANLVAERGSGDCT